jgi:hypothetical protein
MVLAVVPHSHRSERENGRLCFAKPVECVGRKKYTGLLLEQSGLRYSADGIQTLLRKEFYCCLKHSPGR